MLKLIKFKTVLNRFKITNKIVVIYAGILAEKYFYENLTWLVIYVVFWKNVQPQWTVVFLNETIIWRGFLGIKPVTFPVILRIVRFLYSHHKLIHRSKKNIFLCSFRPGV